MNTSFKRIQVIVNPAAGKNEPILNTLNDKFKEYGVKWDARVTHEEGDATRLAQEAVADGVDLVASYGGDGTISEVTRGLINSGVPLAVLPGGTANALAMGLGVPFNLPGAIDAIFRSRVEEMDLGEANGKTFVLRVDMGLSTQVALQTTRELKDRFGVVAYVISGLQAITQPQTTTYQLMVDGQEIEVEGVACIITNHNELGALGLKFVPNVRAGDGLLDAFVVKDTISVFAAAAAQLTGADTGEQEPQGLQHWQGKHFTVHAVEPQDYSLDGDPVGKSPLAVKVLPQVLRILVPETATLD
jgi:YegS/Rv2252/BmrU family lipid kinase